jgi:hypothetical protein
VLDQDADEALHGTEDGAVDHHRHLTAVVLGDVAGVERSGIEKSTWMVPHCQARPMLSRSVNSIFGP